MDIGPGFSTIMSQAALASLLHHDEICAMQEVLSPMQEAWLDVGPLCPPWCANLWLMSEQLAIKRGLEPVCNAS